MSEMQIEQHNEQHGSALSYTIGFLLSLLLTVSAFIILYYHLLSGTILIVGILELAIMQLIIQMFFFLHIINGNKPQWNLIIFIMTISIVVTIVVGSIWIMNHLNYSMTPTDMSNYIIKDEQFTQ